jgi:signal transduction histidine kinase
MKGMMRILVRYLTSAVGIALTLLVVNFVVLFAWLMHIISIEPDQYSISKMAENLTQQDGVYQMADPTDAIIEDRYQWAMLLDESGKVVWDKNIPEDFPDAFTVPEVASFTRWYLEDYPVYVWRRSDGLFVLGDQKHSVWKYNIEFPMIVIDHAEAWIPAALLVNALLALVIALIFGLRMFRSLKPLAEGIQELSEKQPVALSTKGLFREIAASINKASDHLVQQDKALRKRDTAREQWIAAISHDIRTPLSLVMGYASELEENTRLDEGEREQSAIIRRQSQRIKTLLNDLNLTSKLEYDMQPLRLGAVFLPGLVRRVGADFMNNISEGPYRIAVEIEENAQQAEITGDEALLNRALSNLLNNSVQHNPDGCSIQIILGKDDPFFVITVRDDGVGFDEQQCRIFNQEPAEAEQPKSGLGLIIVRQVLQAHGGRAVCCNLPAGGCEVQLFLPKEAV